MMKFLYAVIFIASGVFFLLYRGDLSFYTLLALAIVPVILFITVQTGRRKVSVSFRNTDVRAFRGRSAGVELIVTNRGILPLPNTRLDVGISFSSDNEKETMVYSVPVPSKGTRTVTVSVRSPYCGRAELTLNGAKIYDVMKMFGAKLPVSGTGTARAVFAPLPEEIMIAGPEGIPEAGMPNDFTGDAPPVSSKGSDPSEITGYREFADGDKMSRIHFKLSARFDKDIVKELASQDITEMTVIPDFSGCLKADGTLDCTAADKVLIRSLRTAYGMLEAGMNANIFLRGNVSDTRCELIGADDGVIFRCPDMDGIMEYAYSAAAELTPANVTDVIPVLPAGYGGAVVSAVNRNVPGGFCCICIAEDEE